MVARQVDFILGLTHTQGASLSGLLSALSLLVATRKLIPANTRTTVQLHCTPIADPRMVMCHRLTEVFSDASWQRLHRETGIEVIPGGPSAAKLASVEVCVSDSVVDHRRAAEGRERGLPLSHRRNHTTFATLPSAGPALAGRAPPGDEARARYTASVPAYLAALGADDGDVPAGTPALAVYLMVYNQASGSRLGEAMEIPAFRPGLDLLLRILQTRKPTLSADAEGRDEKLARKCGYLFESEAQPARTYICPEGAASRSASCVEKHSTLVGALAAAGLDCLVVNQVPTFAVSRGRKLADTSGREITLHPAHRHDAVGREQLYFAERAPLLLVKQGSTWADLALMRRAARRRPLPSVVLNYQTSYPFNKWSAGPPVSAATQQLLRTFGPNGGSNGARHLACDFPRNASGASGGETGGEYSGGGDEADGGFAVGGVGGDCRQCTFNRCSCYEGSHLRGEVNSGPTSCSRFAEGRRHWACEVPVDGDGYGAFGLSGWSDARHGKAEGVSCDYNDQVGYLPCRD